jgi:hypothetical protein
MAETRKILAQNLPSASGLIDAYSVGVNTQSIVSTLIACNTSSAATTFRVSAAISGSANTASQYIYYDIPIAGNDTFAATIGMTLYAGDKIRVYSAAGSVSFNLFGVEIT